MINVPGAGQTIAELSGLETRADRITNLGSFGRVNYMRSQDSPFDMLNLITSLERVQPFERNSLGTSIPTPIVDENPINFETQINYFRQSDNRVLAVLTLQTENNQLTFRNSGGIETARLNIFGRVITLANRPVGKFEDSVTTTATSEELTTHLHANQHTPVPSYSIRDVIALTSCCAIWNPERRV